MPAFRDRFSTLFGRRLQKKDLDDSMVFRAPAHLELMRQLVDRFTTPLQHQKARRRRTDTTHHPDHLFHGTLTFA